MSREPVLSVEIKDAELKKKIDELIRRSQDISTPLKECGEYLLISTDDRWEKEIDPNGIPWKPNTPYTIALKKSQGRLLKILQSTGAARNSIRYQITGNTLTVGTNRSYMKKHQLGIGVTKREFLGISDADKEEILEIFHEYYVVDG